jgi:transposase
MGRQSNDQGHLFYEFCLDNAVPADHPVRKIDAAFDLSWVYAELAPHYPTHGRPSIDPVLMIRMLIIGYVFGLRSERLLCREVQVNFAYRWFCKLGLEHQRKAVKYGAGLGRDIRQRRGWQDDVNGRPGCRSRP